MDIDRAIEDLKIAIRHFEQQLLTRLHSPGCFCQGSDKLKFHGCEFESLSTEKHGAGVKINL